MVNKKCKILKTFVSVGLAAVSIMSAGFTSFANEVDNRYAINLYETQAAEVDNVATSSTSGEQVVAPTADHASLTLDVPYYKQKENWYCGPDTALQTYDYFYYKEYGEISPVTQEQMKVNIGTTESSGTNVQSMLNYLNGCGLGCNYTQWWVWNNSVTYYTNQVCNAIDAGVPVIAWVSSPNSTSPLGYTTNGHLLNISGYREYGSEFELTDPYIQWHNTLCTTGKYYVSNSALENITNTISYYF